MVGNSIFEGMRKPTVEWDNMCHYRPPHKLLYITTPDISVQAAITDGDIQQ